MGVFMKFLQEVLANVRRLEAEPGADDPEMSLDTPEDGDLSLDDPSEEVEDLSDDPDLDALDDEHPELDGIADDATDDPNRQGLIRTVKGAHLVYKRETEEGTFEELWIYNVTTLKDELIVKKAILAGTDIPPNKMQSPDGDQSYEIWSAGNAELLLVKGLPN
jgi:hypothetical protein